jgi:hypothetical protein
VDPVSTLAGKTVTGGRLNAANALVSIDSSPSVAITSPLNGAIVAGTILLSATASDDEAISHVSFYLDGSTLLGTDTAAPYEVNWDSTSAAEGTHTITALATDSANQTASHAVNVLVDNFNDPPIANAGLDQIATDADNDGVQTVTLDGSASFDPDGAIVAYEWTENGNFLSDTPTLTVDVPLGSWTFALTVTDDEGATDTDTVVVTVNAPSSGTLHSGDLDFSGSANQGTKKWKATVTVTIHDSGESPVPGATVSIQWSGGTSGTASATTDSSGQYSFTSSPVNNTDSVTLTITSVSHATLTYSAAANHDPDADSDGTSITIAKP